MKNALRERFEDLSAGRVTSLKGFTLIELLVVVLIIGILAAVALPQYEKAVDKSRVAGFIFPKLRAVYQAQAAYIMAHGQMATDFTELDIDITKGCTVSSANGGTNNLLSCTAKGVSFNFYMTRGSQNVASHYKKVAFDVYTRDSGNFKEGRLYCRPNGDGGEEFCARFGKPVFTSGSKQIYEIN